MGPRTVVIVALACAAIFVALNAEQVADYVPEIPFINEDDDIDTGSIQYDLAVNNDGVSDKSGASVYSGTFTKSLIWAVDQGKTVFIPAGEYTVTAAILPASGTVLYGAGADEDGTVLTFSGSTFQASRVWINGANDVTLADLRVVGGGVCVQSTATTVSGIVLQDVTFYKTDSKMPASFWTYTASKGVVEDVSLYRCEAREGGSMGFLLSGDVGGQSTTARTDGGWNRNIYFEDCSAIWCGKNGQHNNYVCGFDLNEGSNSEGVRLKNCVADSNWMNGFHMEMWPYSLDVTLDGCSASDNGQRGTGHGFMYRQEVNWHETTLNGCKGAGNQDGDAISMTTKIVTDLPDP